MAKFLLCDDAKFMQAVSERLLQKMGHEVIYKTNNGKDAIDYYKDHWFDIDIVMMDVVLPKMDGLQALRQLLRINPKAKVIMVTSISSSSIVQGALRAGASDYVVKPFRLSAIARAVDNTLAKT
ncbi:MAG: response regulator [Candidatus Heimdallarchaeota archaeon]|nr:response regulator [Candidatus Heimdallarchaeota archaeon]